MKMKQILLGVFFIGLTSARSFAQLSPYVRGNPVSATWTTATAPNTVLYIDLTKTQWQGVHVFVSAGANLTAGAFTFETGTGSSNVASTQFTRLSSGALETTYSLVSSTKESWNGSTPAPYVQVRLSTAITTSAGLGSTTITLTPFISPNSGGGGTRSQVQVIGPNGDVLQTLPSGPGSESLGDLADQPNDETWRVVNVPGGVFGVTTYVASGSGTLASTPTDIATLTGNGTTVTYVTSVTVSCTQATAGIADIRLVKRSTADSGGTAAAMTVVPLDSNSSAANSTANFYTANPTVGTLVGIIDQQKFGIMAAATASPNDQYIWIPRMGQTITLRGTSQQLGISLNGQTLSGSACSATLAWIEK